MKLVGTKWISGDTAHRRIAPAEGRIQNTTQHSIKHPERRPVWRGSVGLGPRFGSTHWKTGGETDSGPSKTCMCQRQRGSEAWAQLPG